MDAAAEKDELKKVMAEHARKTRERTGRVSPFDTCAALGRLEGGAELGESIKALNGGFEHLSEFERNYILLVALADRYVVVDSSARRAAGRLAGGPGAPCTCRRPARPGSRVLTARERAGHGAPGRPQRFSISTVLAWRPLLPSLATNRTPVPTVSRSKAPCRTLLRWK